MSSERRRVVIAGGGVAGLEAMLALHALAPGLLDVSLVSDREDYAYEPLSVGQPFGLSEVHHYALEGLAREHGARFVRSWVTGVDTARRVLQTESAGELPYDDLLIALGAQRVEALPHALTFYGERNAPGVRELLDSIEAGRVRRVAFVAPPHGVVWPFPLYELALMTGAFVAERGLEVELALVTSAPAPLALFGDAARQRMAELLAERGVQVRAGYQARLTEPGRLLLEPDGGSLEVDRVVALPRLVGPAVGGLPADADGFLAVDAGGRVTGTEAVYAAGDCIAFPVKQGGLAAQEADAAAQSIAAAAGADVQPEPFRPVLRGVLFTGAEREYLRTEMDGGEGAQVEAHTLWWPPAKVAGRYLAPALGTIDTAGELDDLARGTGVAVEVELPHAAQPEPEPELLEFGAGGHGH
jgi:sulfide:quinone oxidoreductase